VKKIISILVALGLVLGLSVMATPVLAQPGVTNLQVAVDLPVACNVSCYNVTFTATNGLSSGQWIRVAFPAGTGLAGVNTFTVTVNSTGGCVVNPAGPTAVDIQHNIAGGIPAGGFVEVMVCNVTNPAAGPHTLTVMTETDPDPVTASFTIAGPTITSLQVAVDLPVACEPTCYNVTFNVTNALSAGQWIRVEFPATTDLSGIVAGLCSVTTAGVTVPVAAVSIAGPLARDFWVANPVGIPAGAGVLLRICTIVNPVAGTYTLNVSTETDQTEVAVSFTIAGPTTITSLQVAVTPDVEFETACYNVTFTVTSALAAGEWISIRFPAGTGLTGANATVNGVTATVQNVTNQEIYIVAPSPISAGSSVSIYACNIANPPAGDYDLGVSTIWDQAFVEEPFTIRAGGCFIATAAYGTPMAEEIQILREFRDEYLLTNPVGQSLVGLYYRVSPPMAEFITKHPSLKPIVRVGLLPAVAMSAVAVNTTPAEKAAIVGLLVLVSVAVTACVTRRRGRGPEYT